MDNFEIPADNTETEAGETSAQEVLSSSAVDNSGQELLWERTEQLLQQLLHDMQNLRQDFDTKIKYDESKERQVDSLHQELQGYREGLHFKILKPVFIDLIAMHDDLDKLIESM